MTDPRDSFASDSFTPVWRSPLALMMLAWMGLAIGGILGAWRTIEALPPMIALSVGVGLLLVAPAMLLVWSFWAMMRDPVTGWIAPSALLAFLGGMIPAWGPLLDAGIRLNFESHHAAYDEIVADSRAGRLVKATSSPGGWVEEDRDGLRFRYRGGRPERIDFIWSRNQFMEAGVRYNARPCRPTPRLKCLAAGLPLSDGYSHYVLLRP
ncbi:MAG: hypothetical protein JNL41_21875 [Phenylobacterium sp.]|uniref:hypothetical protein n=1 Tax=Phenylobacterium sp. TaxID=1871053 RepID=UPI001A3C7220|nr:hypothetical protein [Phenylobacterium sp.]MBL8556936.1 hypothetical protein [Phenylobacterium sp.]